MPRALVKKFTNKFFILEIQDVHFDQIMIILYFYENLLVLDV